MYIYFVFPNAEQQLSFQVQCDSQRLYLKLSGISKKSYLSTHNLIIGVTHDFFNLNVSRPYLSSALVQKYSNLYFLPRR